jgi:hypothetical protein
MYSIINNKVTNKRLFNLKKVHLLLGNRPSTSQEQVNQTDSSAATNTVK